MWWSGGRNHPRGDCFEQWQIYWSSPQSSYWCSGQCLWPVWLHVRLSLPNWETTRPAPARTISDVLMGYSLELVLPDLAKPLEGGALRADLRLHNDVLEHLSYSNSKLSPQEKVVLDCMKETNLYTCGSPLFSEGTRSTSKHCHDERSTYVCIPNRDPILLVHFPPVCYYWGLGEETFVDDDEIKELQTSYVVVLPLCFICKSEAKSPNCKRPSNVAKWAKKSWLLHVLYCQFVHSFAFLHCSSSNKLKWNIWKSNDIHFFCLPPGSQYKCDLSEKHKIKLEWPN